MDAPIKALVEITKLRHYLIILSSFILFFSIIPIFESGLDRYNLMMGAILLFSSSVVFWFCGNSLELYQKHGSKDDDTGIIIAMIAFIAWAILIIISFCFLINSINV